MGVNLGNQLAKNKNVNGKFVLEEVIIVSLLRV